MQPFNLVQDKLLTLGTLITRNVQALSLSYVTMPGIYRWKDGCFFVCLVMVERALNEETYHHYKYLVSNYVKDHPVWKETPPILTVQFRPSLHFTITILHQNPHTCLKRSSSCSLKNLSHTDTMLLQPPREAYPNPQPFFPSHFHYQNYVQPYFVNLSRIQTYICDPFYYAFPNHHLPTYYFQPNPALNPRVLPKPRRNTNIRPKRSVVATTSGVRKWMPKERSSNFQGSSVIISFPKSPHLQTTSTTTTLMIKNVPNQFGYWTPLSL